MSDRCDLRWGRYENTGTSGSDGTYEWVELTVGDAVLIFPGTRDGIVISSGGRKAEGTMPCIIRSGARSLFSKAIEATFPFSITLTANHELRELRLGDRRWRRFPKTLEEIQGTIQFSEYYGTPAAQALGLEIEDRDANQTVLCSFAKDTSKGYWWPLFKRQVRPVRRDQLLRPLQFLIRAAALSKEEENWCLRQEPSRGLLNTWSEKPAPEWLIAVSSVPTRVVAQSLQEQTTTLFGENVQGLEGHQPFTAVPLLCPLPNVPAPLWHLTAQMSAKVGWKTRIHWGDLALVPGSIFTEPHPKAQPGANVQVVFPKIHTHNGDPVTFPGVLVTQTPDPLLARTALVDNKPGASFKVQQVSLKSGEPQRMRIGALDFILSRQPANESKTSTFRFELNPATLRTQPNPDRYPAVEFTADVTLAVAEFRIEGQDEPPNEVDAPQFEPPVLISPGPTPAAQDSEARFALKIEEAANHQRNHKLVMRLVNTASDLYEMPARAIVLDRFPFLLAQVDYRDFVTHRQKTSGTDEIAIWTREEGPTGGWKYNTVTGSSFTLILPAQGVGEQMLKSKWDFTEGDLADYRFTPPARLTLSTSKQRVNARGNSYDELPTNLRRVLGYVGQTDPGVSMLGARFEMAYGLQTEIATPLRLAELGARLGAIPPLIPESDPSIGAAYKDYWRAIYSRHRSRLGVLQAWDPTRTAPDKPAQPLQGYGVGEVTADHKIRFTLRRSTDVADPFDHNSQGLRGGVLWGAEFRATLQALSSDRARVTDTGEVRGLYFSSLGATGFQKAAFADGKVVISVAATIGDTYYYTIEEVGRIGAYWNRAKHVIVYERTVWPTMQFEDEQTPHKRQPILRKVLEYCEITQPKREYPDVSGHQPGGRGFLLSCNFPTTVIRVNSQWGRDIIDPNAEVGSQYIGFEIPLWRSGENSVVYPRPSIQIEAAVKREPGIADQSSGADSQIQAALQQPQPSACVCELKHPENVYFYSLVGLNSVDSNIDAWPAVAECDYSLAPLPRPEERPDCVPGNRDRRIPDASRIPLGHQRYTHELIPIGERMNLTAGRPPEGGEHRPDRAETSLGAFIQNVTVGRKAPEEIEGGIRHSLEDQIFGVLREAEQQLISAFFNVSKEIPSNAVFTGDLRQKVKDSLERVKREELQKVRDCLTRLVTKAPVIGDLNDLHARLNVLITALPTENDLRTLDARLDELLKSGIGGKELADLRAKLDALIVKYNNDGQRAQHTLLTQLRNRLDEVVAIGLGGLDLDLDALCYKVDRAAAEFSATVRTRLDLLGQELEAAVRVPLNGVTFESLEYRRRARIEIEKIFQKWRDASGAIAEFGNRASQQFTSARRAVIETANRVRELAQRTTVSSKSLISGEEMRLKALLANSPLNAVAVDVARTVESVRGQLGRERDEILSILRAADGALAPFQNSILSRVAGDARSAIVALEAQIVSLFEEIENAILASSKTCRDTLNNVATTQQQATAAVGKLSSDAQREVNKITRGFEASIQAVEKVIQDAAMPILHDPGKEYLTPLLAKVDAAVERLRNRILDRFDSALAERDSTIATVVAALQAEITPLVLQIRTLLQGAAGGDAVAEAAKESCHELLAGYDAAKQGLVKPALATIDKGIDDLSTELESLINSTTEAVVARLDRALGEARRRLEPLANSVAQQALETARKALSPIAKDAANAAFQLVRAFGEVPSIPQLDFNCRNIGYYFVNNPNLTAPIDITPITSLVNRLGEGLKPLAMTLPTKSLLQRIVPNLNDLPLNSVIRNVGGLDLGNLLKLPKLSDISSPYIHTEQGLDPHTRRGWLKVFVDDLPIPERPERVTVFDLSIAQLGLTDGKLRSVSSLSTEGRSVDKNFSASLTGDWDLAFGSMDVVTFEKTALTFDESGHLHFNISPDRVRLNKALSFVDSIVRTFQSGTSGFTLEPITMGSIPAGVRARLDLPMPPLGGVTTGVRGLYLGASFELRFLPEFSIATRFFLGLPTKPFIISLFVLGGGGWVSVGCTYFPERGVFYYDVNVALALSASLAVSLGGIISGGVGVAMGVNLKANYSPGGGSQPLTMRIFIQIWGEVNVLGIISVWVFMELSASYQSGKLTATGKVEISVKICWCFTLSISKEVEWTVGSGGNASLRRPPRDLARSRPSPERFANALYRRSRRPEFLPSAQTLPITRGWDPPAYSLECVGQYVQMLDE